MPASMKCLLITIFIGIFLPACKKDAIRLPPKSDPPVVNTPPHLLIPVTAPINATIGGFYAGLPYNYQTGNKKHPLLVFLPGGGQIGNGSNDLPLLLNDGIAQLLDE